MIEDVFLLLVYMVVLCGVLAIGGAIVEGWMWYENRKKLRGKERI